MINKILCCVIPSLQAGGMERVMSELITYSASRENLEIHLILYDSSREIFYPVPDRVNIHMPRFNFKKSCRFLSTLRTMLFVRKSVVKIAPDAVLSFGELWNSLVLLSLIALNLPVYISDRCSPAKSFGSFHSFLMFMLYRRAKGIIVQTEIAKKIYLERFKHKNIRVIGNPIRLILTREEERENIVLTVGRFISSKHHDRLIELFLDIGMPGWRLILVGYDHLGQSNHKRLQCIIDQRCGTDRVMLVGKQTDVDFYYKHSKIFAFTSSSEGFPNVIGEAMSSGLPVVAFDCIAGPSEMIVDGKNGYLVPLFDYQSFRDKLKQLMDNEVLRLSFAINARKDIERFSVEKIGKQYLDLIFNE